LRPLETVTYIHVPKDKRKDGKLDARSQKGFLVGYGQDGKTFRIFIPESQGIGTIHISRDVIFEENGYSDSGSTEFFSLLESDLEDTMPQDRIMELEDSDSDSDPNSKRAIQEPRRFAPTPKAPKYISSKIDESHIITGGKEGRSTRQRTQHGLVVSMEWDSEPQSLGEAKGRSDWKQWENAIIKENTALERMETWELIDSIPSGTDSAY
jgi:hypothetical protein